MRRGPAPEATAASSTTASANSESRSPPPPIDPPPTVLSLASCPLVVSASKSPLTARYSHKRPRSEYEQQQSLTIEETAELSRTHRGSTAIQPPPLPPPPPATAASSVPCSRDDAGAAARDEIARRIVDSGATPAYAISAIDWMFDVLEPLRLVDGRPDDERKLGCILDQLCTTMPSDAGHCSPPHADRARSWHPQALSKVMLLGTAAAALDLDSLYMDIFQGIASRIRCINSLDVLDRSLAAICGTDSIMVHTSIGSPQPPFPTDLFATTWTRLLHLCLEDIMQCPVAIVNHPLFPSISFQTVRLLSLSLLLLFLQRRQRWKRHRLGDEPAGDEPADGVCKRVLYILLAWYEAGCEWTRSSLDMLHFLDRAHGLLLQDLTDLDTSKQGGPLSAARPRDSDALIPESLHRLVQQVRTQLSTMMSRSACVGMAWLRNCMFSDCLISATTTTTTATTSLTTFRAGTRKQATAVAEEASTPSLALEDLQLLFPLVQRGFQETFSAMGPEFTPMTSSDIQSSANAPSSEGRTPEFVSSVDESSRATATSLSAHPPAKSHGGSVEGAAAAISSSAAVSVPSTGDHPTTCGGGRHSRRKARRSSQSDPTVTVSMSRIPGSLGVGATRQRRRQNTDRPSAADNAPSNLCPRGDIDETRERSSSLAHPPTQGRPSETRRPSLAQHPPTTTTTGMKNLAWTAYASRFFVRMPQTANASPHESSAGPADLKAAESSGTL